MGSKKNIFFLISLFYVLYVTFPLFSYLILLPEWLINLSTFFLIFILFPKAFANKAILWFTIYAFILAFFVLGGKPLTVGIGTVEDTKKLFIEYAFLLPSLSIFSTLYYLNDLELYKKISIVGILSVVFSYLIIIPQIFANNTILRDAYLLYVNDAIKTLGIPNYLLMHAYVLLVPPILYGIKIFTGRSKWMLLSLLATVVFVILNTYVTTSLIITITIIAFVLIYKVQKKTRNIILLFFTLFTILFLHISGAFIQMFDFLIDFFEGTAVQPKIEGFKLIYLFGDIENSGGHITGRIIRHDMSWDAFYENILIGGRSPVGGHSNLLDRLGGMGLVAFIPFIMMIISHIKIILRVIKNSEQRLFYYLGLGAAFMILYQKGLFGQEGWLFLMVLLPGLLITFKNTGTRDNNI